MKKYTIISAYDGYTPYTVDYDRTMIVGTASPTLTRQGGKEFTMKLKMELCEGRHHNPEAIHGSIYPNHIENVYDTDELERVAKMKLFRCKELTLFVTGLTVALIAVLNVCREWDIDVTLMHYDIKTGGYYSQEVR